MFLDTLRHTVTQRHTNVHILVCVYIDAHTAREENPRYSTKIIIKSRNLKSEMTDFHKTFSFYRLFSAFSTKYVMITVQHCECVRAWGFPKSSWNRGHQDTKEEQGLWQQLKTSTFEVQGSRMNARKTARVHRHDPRGPTCACHCSGYLAFISVTSPWS